MKFSTLTGLLSLGSVVAAAPAADSVEAGLEKRQSQATKIASTNTRMWSNSLTTFNNHKKSKNPSYLIWTSDGCTGSPDKPFGWNFALGCYRHDFGYRNYKNQKRFTKKNKDKIDKKFLTDLYWVCDKQATKKTHSKCTALAITYYTIMSGATALGRRQTPEEDYPTEPEVEFPVINVQPLLDEVAETEAYFKAQGWVTLADTVAVSDEDLDKIDRWEEPTYE